MSENFSNGAGRIKEAIEHLTEKQGTIETILMEGFDKIHAALKDVSTEIKLTREQGFIPMPIVEKMLDNNNSTSQKAADRVFKVLIAIIVVLLGLREFFPKLIGG